MLLVFSAISASAARRRRRLEEEEMHRQEMLRRQGGAEEPFSGNPFEGMPFGGLLGQTMGGPGMWSRAMAYDEATGRWIDVTDDPRAFEQARLEPPPETPAPGDANGHAEAKRRQPRRSRSGPSTQMANPLQSLFGGGMGGGGSGNFDVQPPEELDDFSEVGGMKSLK